MSYIKQNDVLLNKLLEYYKLNDKNMDKMLSIINGESRISLRIVDWFVTNYAKKHYTVIEVKENQRFKVYVDYKLNLKAYSKMRFDSTFLVHQFLRATLGGHRCRLGPSFLGGQKIHSKHVKLHHTVATNDHPNGG